MPELVKYETSDGVALITMNRPEKLNAINGQMVTQLENAWKRFSCSTDRCAVLLGSGDRAFSVGADLEDPPEDMWRAVPGLGVSLSKPVLASVSGHCIGGAYILVQHCDLAVAAVNTRFSYPEARVGLTGGLVGGAAVRIPTKVAMEMMLLGEEIDATRAYEVGMVNRVVPIGEHRSKAIAWARQLADSSPLVIETLKAFVNSTIPTSPSEHYALARRSLLAIDQSNDRAEGAAAFLDKRRPNFTGN